MKLKNYLFILLTLLFGFSSYAQGTYDVTGNVKGAEDDMPIPGVNVIKVGTTSGTATDFDGNFKLNVTSGDVLEFSSVGYATKKVTITGQKTINVNLSEDTNTLDEVVVIGYGARKKSDITGSVSSVKAEELNAFPVLNAEQAIQGRAAGVSVQSNNGGEPGAPISVQIRGNSSINASSAPLIVVDGFVGATMPQAGDIQSMEVLKDASATAIYGSQGSNGVIMVTTKKGRAGKARFEINSTYSVQNTANRLDLLNAEDFVSYRNTVLENQGSLLTHEDSGYDTDWQDEIYRAGGTMNHQFSFSGGAENANYYASLSYFNQEGVIVNSAYERISFLTNVNAQLSDKFKVGLNLAGNFSEKNGISTQSSGETAGVGNDDVITLAIRFAPDLGLFDEDGNYSINTKYGGDFTDNPWAVASLREDDTEILDFRANTYFDYEILEGLNFKTTFGYSAKNTFRGRYIPRSLIISDDSSNGTAIVEQDNQKKFLTESFLTYKREIGKGILTLLGGISYQKTIRNGLYTEGSNTVADSFSYYGIADATTFVQGAGNSDNYIRETEIQSQFGRLNFDYDDKYLLTATVRRDGASVFAANNKYAIFPSAALGWKVSNESFLVDSEVISNLKLRASYGVTGNPGIGPYESLASYTPIQATNGGIEVQGFTLYQPENPDLKWESSYQQNFGFDLGLLQNKISISADYYIIDTEDLIMDNDVGVPAIAGFLNTPLANVAEVRNEGIEFSVNTSNITNDNFSWTTDIVFSKNKNTVEKLLNGADFFTSGQPSYLGTDPTSILREGEEVGLFWGYEYAGVYDGGVIPTGMTTNLNPVAGDPLFVDQEDEDGNTDGVLDANDRTIIGNPNPDFIWGLTNNFRYKDFDLSIFLQGSQGGDIFNLNQSLMANGDANTTYENFNNAWTPDNTDASAPRVGNNSNRELSSRFVEDGSYVRLKNVAIGYNLPSEVLDNIFLDNVRISLSAQNLLTWTKYSGLDPEVNYTGGDTSGNQEANTIRGFDFGNYPTIRSVSFSVNLKF